MWKLLNLIELVITMARSHENKEMGLPISLLSY